MDMKEKDSIVGKIGSETKIVVNGESPKGIMEGGSDEDDESKSLLLPRRDGLSTKTPKNARKVQWNDTNGHNLTEVLEYQPRPKMCLSIVLKFWIVSCFDNSDSDDEDSDSCVCNIM